MILPKTPSAPPDTTPVWELFRKLLPANILNDLDPRAHQTAYTAWVTTWLLLYQRLHHNASLAAAVSEFLLRFPDSARPDCQRAQQHRLSANTGSYSQARSRLADRVLYWAAEHVFDSLISTSPPSWQGRRAFILDGSTCSLTATPQLGAAFPPASNQHGPSHWPILHLVVAHELQSGLAVLPALGAMYGPDAVAEVALARTLLGRLPQHSILLADRNFGIFAFAHAAVGAGHDVLLRLTQPRFTALRRQAQAAGRGHWTLDWQPSRWDRQAQPDLPAEAALRVHLYEVRVSERLTLWLVTTLDGSSAELAALYRQRWGVETDLRNLKETLALGVLSGQSVAMVVKEVVVANLAYNLVNQVRRLAAERLSIEPRRLSFAGVRDLLEAFLSGAWEQKSAAAAEEEFERLLRAAGQRLLPRRAPGRQYAREVIPRRRKFPERKRPQHDVSS